MVIPDRAGVVPSTSRVTATAGRGRYLDTHLGKTQITFNSASGKDMLVESVIFHVSKQEKCWSM